MCTLTWLRSGAATTFFFSRDERRDRPTAVPPTIKRDGGVSWMAPVDPEGGGTWVTVNELGLGLCILSEHERPAVPLPSQPRSRGALVMALAECTNARHVLVELMRHNLGVYRPFVLVVFAPNTDPMAFHWDGQRLEQRLACRPPLTTSSYRPAQVRRSRRRAFVRVERSGLTPASLERYHRHRPALGASRAVAMSRPQHATVSLTRVDITPEEVTMTYFPGDPTIAALAQTKRRLPVTRRGRVPPPSLLARKQTFDIAALMSQKNPSLHQKMPRVGYALLRWVLAEREINASLRALGAISTSEYPEAALRQLGVEGRVVAACDDGASGPPPIYVANHPLGGLDGLLLLAWLLRRHQSVAAPVNDVLLSIPHLREYCLPLDKSRPLRAMSESIAQAFERNAPVLLFPAGRTSRMVNGRLLDAQWGTLAVRRSLAQGRPIVPVFISGKNSWFFYALARVRSSLRISINLEMFLLPRELLRPSAREVRMVIGNPVQPTELRTLGRTNAARAAQLRQMCYELEIHSVQGQGTGK